MELVKKYKYWIGGAAGIVLVIFLLIQLGVLNDLFTGQAIFFLTFAVIIGGGFAVLRLIQKYF